MNGYEIWFFNEISDLLDISKGRKLLKKFNRVIEADNYIIFKLENKIRDFLSAIYTHEPENIEVIISYTSKLHHIYHIEASYTKIETSEHLFECWARVYEE